MLKVEKAMNWQITDIEAFNFANFKLNFENMTLSNFRSTSQVRPSQVRSGLVNSSQARSHYNLKINLKFPTILVETTNRLEERKTIN